MVGIVSYGVYIPKYRIKTEEIARVWHKNGSEIAKTLGVTEKAVGAGDEDAVTLATEAAIRCLQTIDIKKTDIEALLVGSESHPYAVNPTATIVGEFLGISNNYLAADLQFACKAGTAAIALIAGLIDTGKIKFGLAIGSDTAQSKPHDVLEYTSASAACAVLLGREKIIAKLVDFTSYSSDTPDFWRRDGIRYPTHAGRFTGIPSYFAHVEAASRKLLEKSKISPKKIDYCVFHMPNGKFPREAAKHLGFTPDQLAPSLVVDQIGNPYSASSLTGLSGILDIAKPGQKIFMASYGSGAGSDAFLWETTAALPQCQMSNVKCQMSVKQQIEKKAYIDYTNYLKQTHKI